MSPGLSRIGWNRPPGFLPLWSGPWASWRWRGDWQLFRTGSAATQFQLFFWVRWGLMYDFIGRWDRSWRRWPFKRRYSWGWQFSDTVCSKFLCFPSHCIPAPFLQGNSQSILQLGLPWTEWNSPSWPRWGSAAWWFLIPNAGDPSYCRFVANCPACARIPHWFKSIGLCLRLGSQVASALISNRGCFCKSDALWCSRSNRLKTSRLRGSAIEKILKAWGLASIDSTFSLGTRTWGEIRRRLAQSWSWGKP